MSLFFLFFPAGYCTVLILYCTLYTNGSMGARCHVRARAARSRLHSVRKNWTYDPPITRRTVVDEYGAGPPEVARGSDRGVLRRGGKRDFSPYLNRGLGESHSTVQYAYAYAIKVCGPPIPILIWLTPRLGT